MFTIDTTSNETLYIIYKDGQYFCHIPKATSDLEGIKEHFGIVGCN